MRSIVGFFLALLALCLAQTEENGLGAAPIYPVGISSAHVVRVTAWEDANRDGVRQNDEHPVAGIYTTLYYDSSDLWPDVPSTKIGSEVTGPDGITLYSCVNSGRYSVQMWGLPEGYEYTTATQGYAGRDSDALVVDAASGLAQSQSFTITGPQRTIHEIGVGIRKVVTVGDIQGFVWLDSNYNGIQDTQEMGQGDVVVSLLAGGAPVAQATTDDDGIFTFANVTPGIYQLRFDITALGTGFAFTTAQQGTARSRDSDVNPSTGLTSEFQVSAGFTVMDVDAGIVPSPGTLSGFFWLDQNKNGLQDAEERGISGLQVALLDSALLLTQTVTTDAEGRFSVVVDSISYYVQVLYDTDALVPTQQYVGTDPTLWSELDTTGKSPIVNVSPGRTTSVRGGFVPLLATVEFLVFQDFNENNLYDAFLGDSVFTDYNVTLLNSSRLPISSRLTNAQGIVTFSNLATGSYYIQLSLPGSQWGFVTYRASGSATSNVDSDILTINGTVGTTGEIALVSGQLSQNLGAGIARLYSSISGHVFQDFNRNGVKDATDVSMPGIIIYLLDSAGILAQAFTNSAGDYTFTKLDPGTYGLQIADESLEGYKLAPPKQATDSSQVDSDFPTEGPLTVVVGSNERYCCADAGLQSLSILPASIEGFIWDDYNARTGIQTGSDTPISAGVTVLMRDPNGNTISTSTSNSQGIFFFRDIVPGTYELVAIISAYNLSPYRAGSDTTKDSDFTSFGTTGLFQVIEGQARTDIDLGLIPKDGVVSGRVWFDSNGDGINSAETALAGVAVSLFPIVNGVRTSPLRTVTTSSSGVYSFSPVRPQQYQVYFDKPSTSWTFSPKKATTDTRTDSDANPDGYTDTFTVGPQQTISNVDAGMRIA